MPRDGPSVSVPAGRLSIPSLTAVDVLPDMPSVSWKVASDIIPEFPASVSAYVVFALVSLVDIHSANMASH